MISVRLSRFGRLNRPFYRIVAANKRSKREGKPLEVLGFWDPIKKRLEIKNEKLKSWLAKGAQVSAGLAKLLK